MTNIPAVCNSCSALFFAPNLVRGSGKVEIRNSKISPCPACGGVGDIFDGVYDVATNTAKLIISAATSKEQIYNLEKILRSAKEEKLTHDQLENRIEKDIPELASISDCLPRTRMELYAFIAIVLTMIGMMGTAGYNYSNTNNDGFSESKIEEIIENAINQEAKSALTNRAEKVGRNEPCPCGSGKKYKKCCFLLQ